MKPHTSKIALIVLMFGFTLACSSSESDPEPQLTAEEMQTEKLAKTWVLGTVNHGSDDISERFENFALTFAKDNKYTATGSLGGYDVEPFKNLGTWNFHNNDLNAIGRDDGVVMTTVVTDVALKLSFEVTEENGSYPLLDSWIAHSQS